MKGIRSVRHRIDLARLGLHGATRITRHCAIGGQPVTVEVSNPRELSRVRAYLTREPETVEWIAEYVKSQDVFYDIGANIGLYSIFAAKLHRGDLKVYSFEPESQNYASLNRNVYLNGLSDAITTLCMAVSDSSRINRFYVRGNLRAGEAIHQFGHPTDDQGNDFSPVHQQGMIGVSLDDLCFSFGLEFPTHVKIDTDGHESSVIQGADRVLKDSRLRTVLVEITEIPSSMDQIQEIYARFQEAGFSTLKSTKLNNSRTESKNVIFVRTGG
jgi:FkbM family methyltransferase